MATDMRMFQRLNSYLEPMDDELLSFAEQNGLDVLKNAWKQVNRLLYRGRNPRRVIEIAHFGHWTEMDENSPVQFTVRAVMIWRTREGVLMVKEAAVIETMSPAALPEALAGALSKSLCLLNQWKVPDDSDLPESTDGWTCDVILTRTWRKGWDTLVERWDRETSEQRIADRPSMPGIPTASAPERNTV
ncbi:MAG: hypothetical protein LC772_08940 [Chloroflexi bacterium]|nr:hypothetical protein [Chloroflexota bacterium]